MTQEEKAKAYDEALERARKQKYDYQKEFDKTDKSSQLAEILRAGICAIELAFPELRESEDERIRKELIEYLTHRAEVTGFINEDKDCKRWISYLEKQKEPIEPFDTKLFQDGVKEGRRLEREDIKKEQKPLSTEETELNSIAFLEQMGYTCIPSGAKTAEWSEEDSRMLSDIVGYITGTGSSSGITKQERVDFLYGLSKRFNLQPKQELDEDTAQWVECIIKDYEQKLVEEPNHAATIQAKITVLKSLRPSWKPSEQEKSALRTAIYILTEERNFPKAATQLQNILDAFEGKESRKDWKPSEEQMEALKWLVEYVSPSEKYIVIVKNIYEQLKKFT